MPGRTTLIKGASVATVDASDTVIDDGYVLIEGSVIAAVGHTADAPAAADQVIDASGGIIIPGLINLSQQPSALLAPGFGLRPGWDAAALSARLAGSLTAAERLAAARVAALGMLASATTTAVNDLDAGLGPDESGALRQAQQDLGLRAVITVGLDTGSPVADQIAGVREVLTGQPDGSVGLRVDAGASCRVSGGCSDELVSAAHALATEAGLTISTPVAVGAGYLGHVHRLGTTDVQYLQSLGLLDRHWLLRHACILRDEEADAIGASGATVVHTATADGAAGRDICPVRRLRERGARVTVGTDPLFDPSATDLIEQLKTTMLVQAQIHLDPTSLSATQALRMATIDAATALGRQDTLGSLEVGKKADLAVFDLTTAATTVWHDPVSILLRSLHGRDVRHLFVDGSPVIAQGATTALDGSQTRELIAEVRAASTRIVAALC